MIVNGVPLNNPAKGWVFRAGSVPYSAFEGDLGQVQTAGRDGYAPLPVTLGAPIWPLTVNVAPAGWVALQALLTQPRLVLTDASRPGLEVVGRFASSSVDRVFARNEWVDVTYFVELTGAYWRDKLATTVSQPLTGASHVMSVLPGMGAPVADAVLRLKGAASGVQVTDASGAWVTFPVAPASTWTRFECATGRAFRTATDVWTGGDDVSGLVDFGGPRGVFEITHVMTGVDPDARAGRLTVASATRTGAVMEVRAKGAYPI